MFELRVFDKDGNELELENEIFDGLPFESKKAIQRFLRAISSELPSGYQYKIIPGQSENTKKSD